MDAISLPNPLGSVGASRPLLPSLPVRTVPANRHQSVQAQRHTICADSIQVPRILEMRIPPGHMLLNSWEPCSIVSMVPCEFVTGSKDIAIASLRECLCCEEIAQVMGQYSAHEGIIARPTKGLYLMPIGYTNWY